MMDDWGSVACLQHLAHPLLDKTGAVHVSIPTELEPILIREADPKKVILIKLVLPKDTI